MTATKILVLGSGMVARPCVEYLVRNSNNQVTIACRTLSTAQGLATSLPRTTAISLDVSNSNALDKAIQAHSLVISLVPYTYHAEVIKLAIKNKANVVTTSYVSPAIKELEKAAKEAGIVVLNEVGVDPGVDHLYAVQKIGEIHAQGGKVKEFHSYCGGLPALECANNPLGFKFSWSPRGAIMSQMNSASFIRDGKQVDIAAKDLMATAKPYFVMDGYDFVAYPNRNSVPFREFYKIPEADTLVRGSLRFEGNPAFIKAFADAGWLDATEKEWLKPGMTWAEISQHVTGAPDSSESSLVASLVEKCKFPSEAESDRITSGMRYFGLFLSEKATIRGGNLLDTLCGQLEKLLSFQPGERDLVMLQHKFVVEWKDGKQATMSDSSPPSPSILNWTLGFLLVGLAWGLTTPFIRRAALHFHPPPHPSLERIDTSTKAGWVKWRILKAVWTVVDLLRSPAYAVPLVVNLTGSVWFFLLIGKAELSLTVPITNSLAFLFTVLGEWWVEGKIISRDTWIGMAFVLGGIALCVQSKNA